MPKPILIAVHGMGSQTKESFKVAITDSLDATFKLYPGYKRKKITDYIQIEVIEYNSIFETWRKKLAEDAASSLNELKVSSTLMGLIQQGLEVQAGIAEEDNLYSHWLDVVFYLTIIGEQVRVSVAKQLLEIYDKAFMQNNDPDISILAHSLGTAVIHDTLSKLYMGDIQQTAYSEEWKNLKLDAAKHHFNTLFQIANVSPLLQTFSNPYTSIVRPGENGCCNFMYSIDHLFDPIPILAPFSPDNNEGWLTNSEWVDEIFGPVRISEIQKVNVHDIEHYLANPYVHLRVFDTLIPSKLHVKPSDRKSVHEKYLEGTLKNNVKAFRDALSGVKISDSRSIKEVIGAYKKTAEIVKTYKELT